METSRHFVVSCFKVFSTTPISDHPFKFSFWLQVHDQLGAVDIDFRGSSELFNFEHFIVAQTLLPHSLSFEISQPSLFRIHRVNFLLNLFFVPQIVILFHHLRRQRGINRLIIYFFSINRWFNAKAAQLTVEHFALEILPCSL